MKQRGKEQILFPLFFCMEDTIRSLADFFEYFLRLQSFSMQSISSQEAIENSANHTILLQKGII